MIELAKAYDAKEAEKNHYERWETSGFFAPEINEDPNAKAFSIVIPPPNVTGSLHMGHALQHTLMDVLTRWKRMQGYRTLWLPGTDHAGISVQRKVVEQLRKDENKTPLDVGREEFVRRAWAWKEQYGNTITEQMRREGASVDWSRQRFTMDPELSTAVRNVFVTLYEEGWIYRGLRIVNWCPKDKTVLSDLEVKEETKKDGKLYYLKYPLADGLGSVTVATTRPETMLGDTAVAVNPSDKRYKDVVGKMIDLPLTRRQIPIVADEYVDAEFGTGAVKITPAHDPNDYLVGQRHDLQQLLVMNDDGTMNAAAGAEFEGIDRFEARARVVERFEELGLLDRVEDHEIALPICERCKTIVEPILSEQWFVKMDQMRDLALDLMREEGVPHFSPQVPHEKVYTAWLENLKDWTISRQLWWGHQIPAWYDGDGNVYVAMSEEEARSKAGGKEIKQDQDVLDTWFSSGLWAFSTFGWTGEVADTPDLGTFLPTDVLVTGRDIIFLWVSRMIMLTRKFTGKVAFRDAVITGTVLGKDGKPMSKSRNNGVDPIEMFDKFGVDATRIYLASIATGADIKWNDVGVETYRNFANKIWNATRFCLLNSDGAEVDPRVLNVEQQAEDGIWQEVEYHAGNTNLWIVSRLKKTTNAVNIALERYQFHEAVQRLYHFFWDDFCDWYIEFVKDEITSLEASPKRESSRIFILSVLEQALRLLHPFMPFLTEDLWQRLPGTSSDLHDGAYASAKKSLMLTSFPRPAEVTAAEEKAEADMQATIDLISAVRNIRAEMNIKSGDRVQIHVATNAPALYIFQKNESQILKLARGTSLVCDLSLTVPRASAHAVLPNGVRIAVPLEGLIDLEKERERLSNQVSKLRLELERIDEQLANPAFLEKAPTEKVVTLQNSRIRLNQQIALLMDRVRDLAS